MGLLVLACRGGDWPQFLGPNRNGTCPGTGLASDWNASEPERKWKMKVGEGFSGPVVSSNKVLLFHRLDNQEVLQALNAADGAPIWKASHPTRYRDDFGFDEGPRATPAVASGRVYTFGAEGMLQCVNFEDGKLVWEVDCKKAFQADKGFFGMACSPLVFENKVYLNVGGKNASIACFEAATGKLEWKTGDDEASYSSPVAANLEGEPFIIFFTRSGLEIVNPVNGKSAADFPWRSRMNASVNAATPLVVNNSIFLTASYGTGAVLLDWKGGRLTKVWSGDNSLSSHYASCVHKDGYLYGFDGRQEQRPSFVCVELRSGKTQWRQEDFGAGTVTLAGGKLLVLKESGELVLLDASPKEFKMRGQTQILGSGTRAYPAVADKQFFARDKETLVAVLLP